MGRRSDVSFRSQIIGDVADLAEMSSRRRKRNVNDTDLFETSMRRLTTNLRRRDNTRTGT